jgi:hypothetical protein
MGDDFTRTTPIPGLDGWEVKDGKTCFYFGKESIFKFLCSKNISDKPIKWLLLKHSPRKINK